MTTATASAFITRSVFCCVLCVSCVLSVCVCGVWVCTQVELWTRVHVKARQQTRVPCSVTPRLIPCLSLNLELDWHLPSPSDPPVPASPTASRLQVCMFYVGAGDPNPGH